MFHTRHCRDKLTPSLNQRLAGPASRIRGTVKSFARTAVLFLAGAILFAQQDLTVQWRASLQDLEHRLAESGTNVADWRADEESVRTAVAAFAASNPDLKLQVPTELPE